MRYALHTAEIIGASLLMLAFAALPAHGQSLGEVTAATGVHGTLSRQSTGSSRGALSSVKSSLAKSTKSSGASSGASFGSKPSRSKPTASRSSGPRSGGGSGRGSWVSASSTSRGGQSSAWLQGGNGWNTGGGGRAPARRPRS